MARNHVKTFAFVLMLFANQFTDIYELGIKAACENAGAYCERVDDQMFSESIVERIWVQIASADLIVAEMTSRNPNVFYETGYAHALGKHVILLTQDAKDIPFDLKPFPHIVYGSSITQLRKSLEKRVRGFINNPEPLPQTAVRNALGLALHLFKINPSAGGKIGEENAKLHQILELQKQKEILELKIRHEYELTRIQLVGEAERFKLHDSKKVEDYKEFLDTIEEMKRRISSVFPDIPKYMAQGISQYAKGLLEDAWNNPGGEAAKRFSDFLIVLYDDTSRTILEKDSVKLPTKTLAFMKHGAALSE